MSIARHYRFDMLFCLSQAAPACISSTNSIISLLVSSSTNAYRLQPGHYGFVLYAVFRRLDQFFCQLTFQIQMNIFKLDGKFQFTFFAFSFKASKPVFNLIRFFFGKIPVCKHGHMSDAALYLPSLIPGQMKWMLQIHLPILPRIL